MTLFEIMTLMLLIGFIFILGVLIYAFHTDDITVNIIENEPFTWNGYNSEEIDFAMRYHGISNATFCSKEIEPYFYRDGQKINLFTEDVKKKLEEKC